MNELGAAFLIGGFIALLLGLSGYTYRQSQAFMTSIRARGWQWLGKVSEDGTSALPGWCDLNGIARLRLGPEYRGTYRKVFTGAQNGLQVCGFERQYRRRHGRSESAHDTFLLLHDAQLTLDSVEFLLVQAHPLTDTLADVNEGIGGRRVAEYRIRKGIPGFDAWRVHANGAGAQWLAGSAGQWFAQQLGHFQAPAQHAFGLSGQVIIAEGMSLTVKRLQALLVQAQEFHGLVLQATSNIATLERRS